MRRGFGLIRALVTLAIVGVATWFAYGAGVAQGSVGVPSGGTAVNPGYYAYYGHFGFGFFPLLFFILLLFLLFRRPWGYRHWGGHRGPGWYGGPGGPRPEGGELPPPMDEHLRAWHDRVHAGTTSPVEPTPPTTG